NGLRDIARVLGGPEFFRIRVGIGRPEGRMPPADYVLGKFDSVEEETLASTLALVCSATELLATEGLLVAQGKIHSSSPGV
ncbi:MAG: PTH1 family peptidyl-tRNA hydrolase, partial [Pontimonas sp.]